MADTIHGTPQDADETTLLRTRLEETEETLQAIRQYMVDAFVINRDNGLQVITLAEAEVPYRLIVEAMNEGVITLIPDGTILYCNSCFGQMVMAREEEIIGLQFRDFILPEELAAFDAILGAADKTSDRGEFCLVTTDGTCVPVQLSIYPLSRGGMNGYAIIATDITLRIQAEEKIRSLAAELTVVEQEERHRISQVLHDELQQRLFAIRAQLSSVKDDIQKQNFTSDINESIDQVQSWLSEAITTTRSLSINIDPIVLQGEGLAEPLSWLASQMKEQYSLEVRVLSGEDLHGMDDPLRIVVFQTVRELLFNVVKHAETSAATIQLTHQNTGGRIIVSDAGKGFDPHAILHNRQTAHGLLVVKERLGLMGGRMEIDSAPGGGTRITIEIPFQRISKTERYT
ncbi:MAG TPA: PAS domain S-box protein [Anaerolineales bacterium]|nr:PAS domain S-box protein [Anaerolineales bacterium]